MGYFTTWFRFLIPIHLIKIDPWQLFCRLLFDFWKGNLDCTKMSLQTSCLSHVKKGICKSTNPGPIQCSAVTPNTKKKKDAPHLTALTIWHIKACGRFLGLMEQKKGQLLPQREELWYLEPTYTTGQDTANDTYVLQVLERPIIIQQLCSGNDWRTTASLPDSESGPHHHCR
ncbi:hypothetical protein [Absidia glauca]|uniref:Uncharacterized protein n=1 Tax=Absidia glauca TaxID=4829 RepID=A0A163JX02_ABSGL|nr:hypothetical protein [Absidia glauca]